MPLPHPLITVSPDRLSGAPVFNGTRVPVQTLLDYLKAGDPLDSFLGDFPSVSREHAIAVSRENPPYPPPAPTRGTPTRSGSPSTPPNKIGSDGLRRVAFSNAIRASCVDPEAWQRAAMRTWI